MLSVVKYTAVLASAMLLAGCYSPDGRPDYTANGALIGGASGAAIGAVAARGNPGMGAAVGGVAGLVAGGLIGHSVGEAEDARRRTYVPATTYVAPPPPPPSLSDIKSMTRSGVNDDTIIAQINSTHAVYNLDANAIVDLTQSGVSQRVIAYMMNTPNTVTVVQAPPPPVTETVVVSPGPGYVWVGGEWAWNGTTYVWMPGHWVYPPRHHAVWVGTTWHHGPHGWYHVSGHWQF